MFRIGLRDEKEEGPVKWQEERHSSRRKEKVKVKQTRIEIDRERERDLKK